MFMSGRFGVAPPPSGSPAAPRGPPPPPPDRRRERRRRTTPGRASRCGARSHPRSRRRPQRRPGRASTCRSATSTRGSARRARGRCRSRRPRPRGRRSPGRRDRRRGATSGRRVPTCRRRRRTSTLRAGGAVQRGDVLGGRGVRVPAEEEELPRLRQPQQRVPGAGRRRDGRAAFLPGAGGGVEHPRVGDEFVQPVAAEEHDLAGNGVVGEARVGARRRLLVGLHRLPAVVGG